MSCSLGQNSQLSLSNLADCWALLIFVFELPAWMNSPWLGILLTYESYDGGCLLFAIKLNGQNIQKLSRKFGTSDFIYRCRETNSWKETRLPFQPLFLGWALGLYPWDKSSPLWRKVVYQFLLEPTFTSKSMLSGAHAEIEISPYGKDGREERRKCQLPADPILRKTKINK